MFKEGLEMIPDGGVLRLVTGGAKGGSRSHSFYIDSKP
jgi:hypothetical protein